jgi:hypothetical protein
MYLVYQPDGSDEPKRWEYKPGKLMSAEREMLERRTERTFDKFNQDVIQGSGVCRRALLFMYLKRDHAGVKFADVDYATDELELEFSKAEFGEMIEGVSEQLVGAERDAALAALNKEMATAYEEPGKALSPQGD